MAHRRKAPITWTSSKLSNFTTLTDTVKASHRGENIHNTPIWRKTCIWNIQRTPRVNNRKTSYKSGQKLEQTLHTRCDKQRPSTWKGASHHQSWRKCKLKHTLTRRAKTKKTGRESVKSPEVLFLTEQWHHLALGPLAPRVLHVLSSQLYIPCLAGPSKHLRCPGCLKSLKGCVFCLWSWVQNLPSLTIHLLGC